MCALNIRWGRKGSIQEFSTLLRAPGLPSPSQPSQATLRTMTGWNPATFTTTTTQTAAVTEARWLDWLETKQYMIAKLEPCRDLWAAATAVRLLHPALLIYSKIPSTESQLKVPS